ncbi:hypothetical protein [Nonomuraea sp. NPDC003804]|uniref:hypothetical protein n=1 Tax=Nonomuraea sp. NPDC003804 TaxID=3154547 RepID=UPI0033AF82C5
MTPAPDVEVDEPDAFLLADLDLARDGLMRDIVETIQRDQLRLVADERRGGASTRRLDTAYAADASVDDVEWKAVS